MPPDRGLLCGLGVADLRADPWLFCMLITIWKYVKGASLAKYDFGDVANLRQAIGKVFDEINSNVQSNLTLRFRDPLSKDLLKVA